MYADVGRLGSREEFPFRGRTTLSGWRYATSYTTESDVCGRIALQASPARDGDE